MSMILLEPAYKILHTTVKFKRRAISVTRILRRHGITGAKFDIEVMKAPANAQSVGSFKESQASAWVGVVLCKPC
jgi:hypothetical protein